MTNEEAYQRFKENCSEKVRALMEVHGNRMLQQVSKRPDSSEKPYRIVLARKNIPNKFPS